MTLKSQAVFTPQSASPPHSNCGNINHKHPSPPKRRPWPNLVAVLVATILITLYYHLSRHITITAQHRSKGNENTFRWTDIPPSQTLTWHPCYPLPETPHVSLDCARLDVPMDWLDPGDERAVLAIVRLRANSSVGSYRGPLFFNPGGPGGSGIWALRDHGRDLQAIVGEDYDIVSWDPRGVGASTPRIDCWGGKMADRLVWELGDVGVVDAHPGTVYDAFARARVLSGACEENQEGGVLRHSSTAYHARDLLEILEQMGERGVKYWGFSYGTVLGGTFAAMYPGRVERMVNDGNVDYKEWYNGTYLAFLHDADNVMSAFYTLCHHVGPLRCAFWASSPSAIESRLSSLLSTIRFSPIPVPSTSSPSLITYSSIKRMLSTALYQPSYRFPHIATVLAALERNDPNPYISYTSLDSPPPLPLCSAPGSTPQDQDTPDAFAAITCSDALPFVSSPTEFATYVTTLVNISSAAGAVQASFRLSCAGRTVRPKWRFEGTVGGNTSWPILWVNNEADNVTPLVSARRNARAFGGSRVLVVKGYGHTSLAVGGRCVAERVRGYFRGDEMLGDGEEVCEGGLPWGEEVKGEDELGRALTRLQKARWGFMR